MSGSIYDRLHERRATEEQEPKTPQLEATPPPPPPRYRTNELSFVRPDGFQDKTFHVLTQSETGPSPFSIVVGRSRITDSDKLETLAQRLLHEMEHSLSEFQLIAFQGDLTVDGVPARSVEYRWRQQGKPLQQIQILFFHQDEQGAPLSMQITGTSNNPLGMTDAERRRFEQFITSIVLNRKEADEDSA
ncbi:DcrB-related protein [Pseudomonas aeruginosa]|uniref:DcrB-related protein n=1 Tax=Pseudomonas aeruginosa TaxID=287 RepID=UPI00053D4AD4|nr:DcrB-related protein [Pseudomonas aeruginosa]WCV80976.1 DcrB-related protein [Pseudomonas aeruginosa]HCE6879247.1 DcrB-related protein [Pseudomonas aeruginosa]HDR2971523.1 DcrB-related protein [Pseudomonas aeruginosa]